MFESNTCRRLPHTLRRPCAAQFAAPALDSTWSHQGISAEVCVGMRNASLRSYDVPFTGSNSPDPARALIDQPDPGIGAIHGACSNIDLQGNPAPLVGETGPTRSKPGLAGHVVSAIIGGGFLGFPGLILVSMLISSPSPAFKNTATLVFPVLGALVGIVIYRWRMGRPPHYPGWCVYVGAEGVERLTLKGAGADRGSARYDRAAYMLRRDVRRLGVHGMRGVNGQEEAVELLDPERRPLFAFRAFRLERDAPGTGTAFDVVHQIVEIAHPVRTRRLREAIDAGRTLQLPVFGIPDVSGRHRLTGHGVQLGPGGLKLASPSGQRGEIGWSDIDGADVVEGILEIRARDGAVYHFPCNELADSDPLLALIRERI